MLKYVWHGLEIGDADAAAKMINIASAAAYQSYTRRDWVRFRKPPVYITRDGREGGDTGKKMYPLRMVDRDEWEKFSGSSVETLEEWQKDRPGRGNWGGEGARAHYRPNPPKAKTA